MTSKLLLTRRTTWIIVADESVATVYARKSRRGPLTELFRLTNETARKKMGDLGSSIKTVHGVGYRFIDLSAPPVVTDD